MAHYPIIIRRQPVSSEKALPQSAKNVAIRILVADAQAIFRECLCAYLKTKRRFAIVGETSDVERILELTKELNPDVLILDTQMEQLNCTNILQSLRLSHPELRVITLSASMTNSEALAALQLGVRAMVLKTDGAQVLIETIHKVMNGEYWIGKRGVSSIIEAMNERTKENRAHREGFGLTTREREIVRSVVAGYSNPEIAAKFSVSVQTVKHHLTHVFEKLGVYSRVELALFAVSHEL